MLFIENQQITNVKIGSKFGENGAKY